jgi:hypothetical protein
MNSRIMVLAVFLSLITALSACSKDLGQNEQFYPSDGLVNSSNNANRGLPSLDKSKNTKNNSEILLEYARRVAKRIDFMGAGDYAKFMYTLGNEYKDDIINPYTGVKYMDISNRTTNYFKKKNSEIYLVNSVDLIVIDDFMTELKEINTSDVVYCLNPLNKGCIIAFLFKDGIYIYEVDENGGKKNEIKHYFKDDGL